MLKNTYNLARLVSCWSRLSHDNSYEEPLGKLHCVGTQTQQTVCNFTQQRVYVFHMYKGQPKKSIRIHTFNNKTTNTYTHNDCVNHTLQSLVQSLCSRS